MAKKMKKIKQRVHGLLRHNDGAIQASSAGTERSPDERDRERQSKSGFLAPFTKFLKSSRAPSTDSRPAGTTVQNTQLSGHPSAISPSNGSRTQVMAINERINTAMSAAHIQTAETLDQLNVTADAGSCRVSVGVPTADTRQPQASPPANSDNAECLRGELDAAQDSVVGMSDMSGIVNNTVNTVNTTSSAMDRLGTISFYLQPLKDFASIIDRISGIHPYAELALLGLSWAAQVILAQAKLDEAILDLLGKVSDVYKFLLEGDTFTKAASMGKPLADIANIVSKCAELIKTYAKDKSFWVRLRKNLSSENTTVVAAYSEALDTLTQHCRDLITRKISENVTHVVENVDHIWDDVTRTKEDARLDQLVYADGAGRDDTKICLEGTRIAILKEIVDWVCAAENDTQRVLWLHGQAGKGKSAIVHTIARWLEDHGRLGSFFCFALSRNADRRHEKIFTTIARDLADHDPHFRHAIANIISHDNALAHTADVTRQWKKLICGPMTKLAERMNGPLVIVIDALDESGDEMSRMHILDILASTQVASLPSNIRMLITSRGLSDITEKLLGSSHIESKSMDDISAETVQHDIELYITKRL
ncbi:hypothetical protein ID866_9979, partial [Astraeus odoratus]